MSLNHLIRRLLRQGALPDQPYSFENRRILLLNKVALFSTLICIGIIIVHVAIGNTIQPLMVSLGFLVTVPTVLLQAKGHFGFARAWFLLGFFLLISGTYFYSVTANLQTSGEFVLVVMIPVTLIFLDGKKAMAVSAFIILYGSGLIVYRDWMDPMPTKTFYGSQMNWYTISFVVHFCMSFFKKSLLRANRMMILDKEQLAEADKTKNFLFAVISHDIRSPLKTLKQYFLLDAEQRNDPEQFMILQKALSKKVDEISQTLDDLLFWSKTQLQGITTNPGNILMERLILKVTGGIEETLRKKEIALRLDTQSDHSVTCDPDHLTVVLRNLIQNAIKFTPRGGTLSIRTTFEGENVLLSVTDTGKGMDESTLKNLREGMIVKSHLGTAGEIGTGLGLSLVKELITQNHGQMHIDSKKGEGTTVTLILPSSSQ